VRVTSAMYYKSMLDNSANVTKGLFDVNKQIASGRQIQYAHENTETFINTLRLDSEITTHQQVKESSQSALKFSTQSDTVLNDFTSTLDTFKVKLVAAASDSNSPASLEAIAKDLRGLKSHLINLSNTTINGNYLFSGSATDVKPISSDGVYHGNDGNLKSFFGADQQQKYNISGTELFLGEESSTHRLISSNLGMLNQTRLHPTVMDDPVSQSPATNEYVNENSTIRDMIGDVNSQTQIDNGAADYFTTHFYVRGTDHGGDSFKQRISLAGDESVDTLLNKIGAAYGNTLSKDIVNVSMNPSGQIVVEDKLAGSSKLDFHMVAATDFDLTDATDTANVVNLDNLDGASTSLSQILQSSSANKLMVTEFNKSNLDLAGTATNIEGLRYDKMNFAKDGTTLFSNTPQIDKTDNSYATESTKLSDVSSSASAEGTKLTLQGSDVGGIPFDITVNISTGSLTPVVDPLAGSFISGTVDGVAINPIINILNAATPRVGTQPDDMTYKQLMDVINMVVTGNVPDPAGTNADPVTLVPYTLEEEYDFALKNSYRAGDTILSEDGRIMFQDSTTASDTKASFTLHDATVSDFFDAVKGEGSSFVFEANSALSIKDPKTDFFARIEEAIVAVESNNMYPDGDDVFARNGGIQNAIQMVSDLNEHVGKMQTQVGAQSNTISSQITRTEMLLISTKTLQSEFIDTDIAEASLRLNQLSLNYQAMMSSISRISQLSLVNYL